MGDPVGLAGDPPGRAADQDIQRHGKAGILAVGIVAIDHVGVGVTGGRKLVARAAR